MYTMLEDNRQQTEEDIRMQTLQQANSNVFSLVQRKPWKIVYALLIAVVLLFSAGLIIGKLILKEQEQLFRKEIIRLSGEVDPDNYQKLQEGVNRLAVPIINQPKVKIQLAVLYAELAENVRFQKLYYEEIKRLLNSVQNADHVLLQQKNILLALVYAKEGNDRKAWELLQTFGTEYEQKAGSSLTVQDIRLMNFKAFLLATTKDETLYNPAEAFRLVSKMMESEKPIVARDADGKEHRFFVADVAAYLDTLAWAYHAIGENAQAVKTQRMALAKLTGQDAWELVRAYDLFKSKSESD